MDTIITKVCTKCKIEKGIEDFPIKSERPNGYDTICRTCYNERKRAWSKSHLGRSAYQVHKRRYLARKRQAVEYMGDKCQDCGNKFDDIAYDFHHLNPEEKERSVSSMRSLSWERFKVELDKCILLCSNCHRVRHKVFEDGIQLDINI